MFPASPCREFQIGNFANFEQFQVDIHFANFGQVKTVPIRSVLLTLDRSQLFYCVWVRHAAKNNPNPLHLIKIQEPRIGSGTSYFQRFTQQKLVSYLSQ